MPVLPTGIVLCVAAFTAVYAFNDAGAIHPPPLASTHAAVHNGPLASISVTGTHYEVGYAIGARFASMIADRWAIDPGMEALYAWAMSNATLTSYNQSWYAATKRQFPFLLDELRGVADGSGLGFSRIWFMTTQHEVSAAHQAFVEQSGSTPVPPPDRLVGHCTDVRSDVPTGSPLWGHNEDSDIADANHTYLVFAKVVDGFDRTRVLENFTSYSYAGTVAGVAYGWNHHGLIVSLNALFSRLANLDRSMNTNALPRGIINRALYAERTVHDATRKLLSLRSVVSFSANVGHFNESSSFAGDDDRFVNVEVDPMGAFSVTKSTHRVFPSTDGAPFFHGLRNYLYHANEYLWLTTAQFNDTSSAWRIKRLNELQPPQTEAAVRAMLGDTHYPAWPVYRDGLNGILTLSTAMFDIANRRVVLYNGNPMTADPIAVVPVVLTAPPHGEEKPQGLHRFVRAGTAMFRSFGFAGCVILAGVQCVLVTAAFLLGRGALPSSNRHRHDCTDDEHIPALFGAASSCTGGHRVAKAHPFDDA